MLWQYAANMMILFIVSSAAFCLLLITYASSHPNKVQLLAVLSLTIIACNFINKWQTEHIPLLAVPTASPDIRKVTPARIKLTLAE